MPYHSFICQDCKKEFEAFVHMRDVDRKGAVKCPHCGSETVEMKLSAFYAVTSKKS